MIKILMIEDDWEMAELLEEFLARHNIAVENYDSPILALSSLDVNAYDLVILDLWLPDIDWLELCEKIRNSERNIPILMLTARDSIKDKLAGFNSWADDYLTKPFDYEELLMRINALVRRNYTVKSNNIILWEIEVNLNSKKVLLNRKEVHLSNLEMNLLIYLIQNKWKVISKEELLEKVWGEYDAFLMSRTVDVYIWYLRKKLWKEIIETVRWQWYIIN